jgi:hypothetical protein
MKPQSPLGTNKTNDHAMQGRWQEMNRRQRRETMRKIQSEDLSLEVIHRNAAGIDIGNESHYVAVPPSRDSQPVRCYGCTTGELKAMADWLKQCGIQTVAMQSTGVYWVEQPKPLPGELPKIWGALNGQSGLLDKFDSVPTLPVAALVRSSIPNRG